MEEVRLLLDTDPETGKPIVAEVIQGNEATGTGQGKISSFPVGTYENMRAFDRRFKFGKTSQWTTGWQNRKVDPIEQGSWDIQDDCKIEFSDKDNILFLKGRAPDGYWSEEDQKKLKPWQLLYVFMILPMVEGPDPHDTRPRIDGSKVKRMSGVTG